MIEIICSTNLRIHKIVTPEKLKAGELGLDIDWEFHGDLAKKLYGRSGIIYNFSEYKGPGVYDVLLPYDLPKIPCLGYFWEDEEGMKGLVVRADNLDDTRYAQEVSNPYICEKKKSNKRNSDRNETV